jgi:hypothetical protein
MADCSSLNISRHSRNNALQRIRKRGRKKGHLEKELKKRKLKKVNRRHIILFLKNGYQFFPKHISISEMEFLEKYKDVIMRYIPIGLLIIIFVGMLASQLSGFHIIDDGLVTIKPFTFGLEDRIQIIG